MVNIKQPSIVLAGDVTPRILTDMGISIPNEGGEIVPVFWIGELAASPIDVACARAYAPVADGMSASLDDFAAALVDHLAVRASYQGSWLILTGVAIVLLQDDDVLCIWDIEVVSSHTRTGITDGGFTLANRAAKKGPNKAAIWAFGQSSRAAGVMPRLELLDDNQFAWDVLDGLEVALVPTPRTAFTSGMATLFCTPSTRIGDRMHKPTIGALDDSKLGILWILPKDDAIGMGHFITSACDRFRTVTTGQGGAETAFSGATLVPTRV
jgi:hypothetical protein